MSDYSYQEMSPGYTTHVVAQATKFLVSVEAEFAQLFVEEPITPKEKLARGYFLKLDANEQAALREVHESMATRVGCF